MFLILLFMLPVNNVSSPKGSLFMEFDRSSKEAITEPLRLAHAAGRTLRESACGSDLDVGPEVR